jgi:hypothetical protein
MFGHSEQDSPISEGVVDIRINMHHARDKIWQHDTCEPHRHHECPQFMMTIKELSQTHRTLVQVFHAIPHRASVGGPHTIYPNVTREVWWGVVQLSDHQIY